MGLINVQSLLPKIAALQHDHLNRLHYDICVLTETWLRSATPFRLVTFPGYALHRADRPGGAGYGGVAVLVRDSYEASVIPQPASDCADCRLESLWLRVKPVSGPCPSRQPMLSPRSAHIQPIFGTPQNELKFTHNMRQDTSTAYQQELGCHTQRFGLQRSAKVTRSTFWQHFLDFKDTSDRAQNITPCHPRHQ